VWLRATGLRGRLAALHDAKEARAVMRAGRDRSAIVFVLVCLTAWVGLKPRVGGAR